MVVGASEAITAATESVKMYGKAAGTIGIGGVEEVNGAMKDGRGGRGRGGGIRMRCIRVTGRLRGGTEELHTIRKEFLMGVYWDMDMVLHSDGVFSGRYPRLCGILGRFDTDGCIFPEPSMF
jgi:hypothetical protein